MRVLAKAATVERAATVSPGMVVEASPGAVVVSREGGASVRAILAVAGGYAPQAGDRVVLADGHAGESYVIGVVSALREVPADPGPVSLAGARTGIEARDGTDVLAVRDAEGRLLFEHRPSEGTSVVYAPHGNLAFRADEGRIDFTARDRVTLESAREVRLVRGDPEGVSEVVLDGAGVSVATPRLEARARHADVTVGDVRVVARSLSTAVETVKHVVGVVEVEATRIVERAKNVYREVAELSQTRAGRMKLIADATLHLVGKRTLVKGEHEVKIKADKIHLA